MDYWKAANVTQLKRWILIHHEFLQKCVRRSKQQKWMQVQDIRRYFKKNKNGEESSKIKNKTNSDTNTLNTERYATVKTQGYHNHKKNKKQQTSGTEENSQCKDILQFFEHAGISDSPNNNTKNQKQKGQKQRKEGTTQKKKPEEHNYTKITQYYSTQDKPPDKCIYVQQKLDTFVERKLKKR